MKFAQTIGSIHTKDALRSLVDEDNMPHALLLSGAEGNSKLALALAYTTYLMCENRADGASCGSCRSCIKMEKYIHPDVHFSFPFTGAKSVADEFIKPWRKFIQEKPYAGISDWMEYLDAPTKQPNINTKECKAIIQKLNMQSFESTNKVLIMWLPEYLRKEGNRLLKIIEEPTPNTYFILITEKISNILPTIISRCQLVKVPPLQDKEIKEALMGQYRFDASKAQNAAFVAEGNMQKALDIVQIGGKGLHDEVLVWFRTCYSQKTIDLVNWVDNFDRKSKDEQKSFLMYALNFFREIARVPVLPEKALRIEESEIQTAKKIAGIINFEKIEKLNNILTDTIYYIERNANIKVLMMDTNIAFKNILRQK